MSTPEQRRRHIAFEKDMQKRLKPCAHCGSKKPRLVQWRDTLNPNATWVECSVQSCKMMTSSYYHTNPVKAAEQAMKVWNRRAPDFQRDILRTRKQIENMRRPYGKA